MFDIFDFFFLQGSPSNGIRRTPIFEIPGTATSDRSSIARYIVRDEKTVLGFKQTKQEM